MEARRRVARGCAFRAQAARSGGPRDAAGCLLALVLGRREALGAPGVVALRFASGPLLTRDGEASAVGLEELTTLPAP